MEKWALNAPSEVCKLAGEYSEWALNQYDRQSCFGFGSDDILIARKGYNLTAPIHFAVWKACRKRFNCSKTRYFTVTDLIEDIRKEKLISIPFDRTSICHSIGQLRALGLVYRLTDGIREYEYVFEDVTIEKGMDWFLKNNKYIINPPPLGGFFDEELNV
jgi:hypothetical protein